MISLDGLEVEHRHPLRQSKKSVIFIFLGALHGLCFWGHWIDLTGNQNCKQGGQIEISNTNGNSVRLVDRENESFPMARRHLSRRAHTNVLF